MKRIFQATVLSLAVFAVVGAHATRPAHALLVNLAGDPSVSISVVENAGALKFTVTLTPNPTNIGDLRGVFFNVSDDSLLSTLSVTGTDVNATAFLANSVNFVGSPSNNINGAPPPSVFDAGVEIGTPGIGAGGDDIQSTMFTLTSSTTALTESLVSGESFGVRIMSVGAPGSNRDESLKLTRIPEPSALALFGLGLLGLGLAARRRRTA